MADPVLRYVKPLDLDHLQTVLEGGAWPTEPLPSKLSLEPVAEAINALHTGLSGTQIDAALVEPLHRALAGLSRREAADMRVWHWLCVRFDALVWRRWEGGPPLPETLGGELGVAMSRRFLGRAVSMALVATPLHACGGPQSSSMTATTTSSSAKPSRIRTLSRRYSSGRSACTARPPKHALLPLRNEASPSAGPQHDGFSSAFRPPSSRY